MREMGYCFDFKTKVTKILVKLPSYVSLFNGFLVRFAFNKVNELKRISPKISCDLRK